MRRWFRRLLTKIKYRADHISIPGYKNVTLLHLFSFYGESIRHGNLGMRSAGISFRFLTALFPLCIFFFSIIPFIPVPNLQENLMLGIKDFFPEQIYIFFHQVLIDLIVKKHKVLLSLGFILSIYFASNAVDALITGLNSSYHVYQNKKAKLWRQKLTSIIVLLIIFAMFIFSFILNSGGQWLINYLYDHNIIQSGFSYWLLVLFKAILSFFMFMLCISVLYNIANTDRVHWNFFSIGAITTTLLIFLLKEGFGLYLTYFGKFDKVYGHIGAGLAFLVFIYYLFNLLVLGFEINTSLQKAYYKKNYKFEPGSSEFESYRQAVRQAKKNKNKK